MCTIFKSASLNTFYYISSQKPRSPAKHRLEESYTELWRAVTMNILVQRDHKNACAYFRGFNEKMHKEVAEKLNSGGITWIKFMCIFSSSCSHTVLLSFPMLLTLGSTRDLQDISRTKGQVISPALPGLLNLVHVAINSFLTMHVGDGDAWLKFYSIRNVYNKSFTLGYLLIRYKKHAHRNETKGEKSHCGGGTRISSMSFLPLSLAKYNF